MPRKKPTILESWPALREDLHSFLSDTDDWAICELTKAYEAKDWESVRKVLEVMEFLHDMAHTHEH